MRFDRLAEQGHNGPLHVRAEVDDGETNVIVKPSARPEVRIEGVPNEMLAAKLSGWILTVCTSNWEN